MDAKQALKMAIKSNSGICDMYLADLSDADLLVRPVPGANHIAWQLGHLISAENEIISAVRSGLMPKLPEGFTQKHKKETSGSDDHKDFYTKDQYLAEYKKQREATLALLADLSEADLDKPAPEALQAFVKTVAEVFMMQGTHWLMHAGQWAVVRRKLGKPPLF